MRIRMMLALSAATIALTPLVAVAQGTPTTSHGGTSTTMSAKQGTTLTGQAALAAVQQHGSSSTFSYHGSSGALLSGSPNKTFASTNHESKLLH